MHVCVPEFELSYLIMVDFIATKRIKSFCSNGFWDSYVTMTNRERFACISAITTKIQVLVKIQRKFTKMIYTPTMAQMIRVFNTCSSSAKLKQLYWELSFMQSVLLNMSLCPIFCPGFSGTIVAFLRRLFLLKWLYGFIKNNVYDDNYCVYTHIIKIDRWASIDSVYKKLLCFYEEKLSFHLGLVEHSVVHS